MNHESYSIAADQEGAGNVSYTVTKHALRELSKGRHAELVRAYAEGRYAELFELQADEGPCVDCYRSGEAVLNEGLEAAKARWPAFTSVAVEKARI